MHEIRGGPTDKPRLDGAQETRALDRRVRHRSRAAGPGDTRPTLEDVARLAGVSTATVSRCLNTPDRVVEQTRTRVMQVVRELGYAPNFGARAMAAKRTNTFGAIIPTMENAIFARGIQAFQEELGRHGITLLVASSSYRPDLEDEQVRALVARGADALLLIGHERSRDTYDFLERRHVPFLISWVYDAEKPYTSIGFDNRGAMRALAERVFSFGHQRIGLISAPRAANDRARERYKGIAEAMDALRLDPAELIVIETPYSIENGRRAFEQMMHADPRPTVVMCGNDVLAAGAMAAARSLGLKVPEDVSITGFDDIEIAQLVSPTMTTVHVPHREMGREAARLLIAMRDDQGARDSVRLETEIRIRDSLGPAPARPAGREGGADAKKIRPA